MYLTYPISIKVLDKKVNEFISNYSFNQQFDLNLNEEERMNVYAMYSLAFAKIARINTFYSQLIKLIDDCIKKGEVVALVPLKGYSKIELLYVGKPTVFIIVYPFTVSKHFVTDNELLTLAVELLYHIIFISHVMEYNSYAFSENREYANLDDPYIEIKFQKLRLNSFKSFWSKNSYKFNDFDLPDNLETIINN